MSRTHIPIGFDLFLIHADIPRLVTWQAAWPSTTTTE
jgi:hypothetical protein